MKHLRENTLTQQTVTRRIGEWVESPASRVEVPAAADYFSGFARAVVQTLSPSSVRGFFRELDANDRVLSRLGWALLLVVPVFAALALFVPATVGTAAVNPWIKPIKFSMSFSTFASTISLLLMALQIPRWQLTLVRRVIATSVGLEILSLAAQAWRSAYQLSGHSLLDTSLAQMTNSMVMINTGIVCWMLVLFCVNRVRTDWIDRPMVSAIRYSIVIFLAGNAIVGYMLARGSHTVGVADGGPGLPFVNWSVIGGDLRIAHFIAIHAIQIVPLFAYILSQMAPILPVKYRRMAVGALAIAVSVGVGATFVQAALGRPLIPWVH
ncbi:MAG TPA: hypothetical protein VN872_08170 [Candidatus Acidoferrum sp.]|nr:hypothetical protein [Candidatus Acidoferrum sp.]